MQDAATVMRELADVRVLAGKIWGLGLNEVKAFGQRMLLGTIALIAGLAGIVWAGRYYLNGAW